MPGGLFFYSGAKRWPFRKPILNLLVIQDWKITVVQDWKNWVIQDWNNLVWW